MSNFFAGPNIPLSGGGGGDGGPINVTDVIGLEAELQRIAAAEAAAAAAQQVASDASGLVGGASDRLDVLDKQGLQMSISSQSKQTLSDLSWRILRLKTFHHWPV